MLTFAMESEVTSTVSSALRVLALYIENNRRGFAVVKAKLSFKALVSQEERCLRCLQVFTLNFGNSALPLDSHAPSSNAVYKERALAVVNRLIAHAPTDFDRSV